VPQNYNVECAYANGIFAVADGLDFSKLGAMGLLLLVGDYSIRQLVLHEKDFGWMAFWELNPEVLGSLWLMAFVTWRGNHFG
jgi:hypothetical protein